MPIQGHAQCAHCGALLSSDDCTICGKSVHDVVAVAPPAARTRGMSDEAKRQVRGFGIFMGAAAVIGIGALVVLGRENVEPTPTALALPSTTTTVFEEPAEETPVVTRPFADVAPLPTLPVADAVEREVGDGANPWNGALPRNVLTGELLENTDYAPGIDAVAALLAETPNGFAVGEPADTEWNGIDLADAETVQPFAARGIADETGPVADLWIFARGADTNDGSAALFEAATSRWPIAEPIESFAPRPGIRLHRLPDEDGRTIWVDVRDTWMLVYRAPVGVDPGLLGAISETWG
ncbi:MAG: hypothetical protein AAGE98_01420 [Actinomycetota bacterium]